jgi:hypothetical protein
LQFKEECENFAAVDNYNKINHNILTFKDDIFSSIKNASEKDTYEEFYLKWEQAAGDIKRLSKYTLEVSVIRMYDREYY